MQEAGRPPAVQSSAAVEASNSLDKPAAIITNGTNGHHPLAGQRKGVPSWSSAWADKRDMLLKEDSSSRQATFVARVLREGKEKLRSQKPARCLECWRTCEGPFSSCVCDLVADISHDLELASGSSVDHAEAASPASAAGEAGAAGAAGAARAAGAAGAAGAANEPPKNTTSCFRFRVVQRVTLLYHFREMYRSSNSGTVLRRVFPGCSSRLVHDVPEDNAALALLLDDDTMTHVVLWPGKGSVALADFMSTARVGAGGGGKNGDDCSSPCGGPALVLADAAGGGTPAGEEGDSRPQAGDDVCCGSLPSPPPLPPPLHVILLDGTWTQARQLNKAVPRRVPRVRLEQERVSAFALRKQHGTDKTKISTVEAFMLLLEELGGEPQRTIDAIAGALRLHCTGRPGGVDPSNGGLKVGFVEPRMRPLRKQKQKQPQYGGKSVGFGAEACMEETGHPAAPPPSADWIGRPAEAAETSAAAGTSALDDGVERVGKVSR